VTRLTRRRSVCHALQRFPGAETARLREPVISNPFDPRVSAKLKIVQTEFPKDIMPHELATPGTATRLGSLDVLRGITVAFMILVNNGVGELAFGPLKHARWNGWTPTDMVFPTFVFLMGTSLVLSFESRLRRGVSRGALFVHIVRRSVILFLLGLLVNGFPLFPWETLRIYGVLQRFAICYLCVGSLYLLSRRVSTYVIVLLVALLGYWMIMTSIPVPGYGMPGVDIPLLDPDGNLVAHIDRLVFPGRLYEGVRDPEGLLSTLPAIGTTALGVLCAMWLRSSSDAVRKLAVLVAAGALSLMLGEFWSLWFPINKKLWTSSFVLFAGGWALLSFALCYWLVDMRGCTRRWTYVWMVFGTNAIAAYVFAELLQSTLNAISVKSAGAELSLQMFIFQKGFAVLGPPGVASLLYSSVFVAVCFLPVAWLHRRGIHVRV
jgi:predicted acyltransferase